MQDLVGKQQILEKRIVCSKHVLGNACSNCGADEKNLKCPYDKTKPIVVRYYDVVEKNDF